MKNGLLHFLPKRRKCGSLFSYNSAAIRESSEQPQNKNGGMGMDHYNANDAATVELLAEMYRNVKMGSESLAAVVPKIRDKGLMATVTAQLGDGTQTSTNKAVALPVKSSPENKVPVTVKLTAKGSIFRGLLDKLFNFRVNSFFHFISSGISESNNKQSVGINGIFLTGKHLYDTLNKDSCFT